MVAPISLGIDLGTQQIKVLAVDVERACVLGSCQAPLRNFTPETGALEQDPLEWWPLLCELTRRLVRELEIDIRAICGIGLSGHMHSIVPLTKTDAPAYNCIVWADTRADKQARRVAAHRRGEYWNPAIAAYSLPKILWLKETKPDIYAKVTHILFSKDFLRFQITGAQNTDFSDASGTLAWNFEGRQWDEELLDSLGVPVDFLPQPHDATWVGGILTDTAASALGLRPGIPVAVGAGDVACAVTGSGVNTPNTLLINAGTAAQIILLQATPTRYIKEQGVRYLFELGFDAKTFVMGALPSAGFSLEWWRVRLGDQITYADLDNLAQEYIARPENPVFVPFLQGTGTPYLIDEPLGAFLGLSGSTDSKNMTCAVMEGVAFGIRQSVEALVSNHTFQDLRILVTGGLTKSPVMRTILVNVLGQTVSYRHFTDVSAIGAASFGAVAAKEIQSVTDLLGRFPVDSEETNPNPELMTRYESLYTRFQNLSKRVVTSGAGIDP